MKSILSSVINLIYARAYIFSKNAKLLEAAKNGDYATVKKLLNKGSNPNIRNNIDMSILAMAAIDGDVEVVMLLLEKGADVDSKKYSDGFNPLIWAAQSKHLEIVKLLLEKGADVDAEDVIMGTTSLWIASQNGYAEIVKLLLEKGADVNQKLMDDGTSALWIATQNGYLEVVKTLLENGADVNVKRNCDGVTPLYMAAKKCYSEIVKLLLEKGADVNQKLMDDGTSALWIATQKGHLEVVKTLLKNGADVNVKRNCDGVTPLYMAAKKCYSEIVKILLDNGADINVKITTNSETQSKQVKRANPQIDYIVNCFFDYSRAFYDGYEDIQELLDGKHYDLDRAVLFESMALFMYLLDYELFYAKQKKDINDYIYHVCENAIISLYSEDDVKYGTAKEIQKAIRHRIEEYAKCKKYSSSQHDFILDQFSPIINYMKNARGANNIAEGEVPIYIEDAFRKIKEKTLLVIIFYSTAVAFQEGLKELFKNNDDFIQLDEEEIKGRLLEGKRKALELQKKIKNDMNL